MKEEDVVVVRRSNKFKWFLALTLLVVAAGAVVLIKTGAFSKIPNPNHYVDVADWVQDVKNNVPDSERRHTFVASVYAFMDDNVITNKEYGIIKDNYDDLKLSIAITSIHDNIKLMRAPNEFSLTQPGVANNDEAK